MDYTLELWHGTTEQRALGIKTSGIKLSECNPMSDFGRGFYLTSRKEQAEEWAVGRASRTVSPKDKGAVLRYGFCFDAAAHAAFLSFVVPSEQNLFWPFVERNRLSCDETGRPHGRGPGEAGNFDIVIGPVMATRNPANRKIYDGYDQYSFHTDRALALLQFVDYRVLS